MPLSMSMTYKQTSVASTFVENVNFQGCAQTIRKPSQHLPFAVPLLTKGSAQGDERTSYLSTGKWSEEAGSRISLHVIQTNVGRKNDFQEEGLPGIARKKILCAHFHYNNLASLPKCNASLFQIHVWNQA